MASDAVRSISDQMAVKLDDLQRFMAMTGVNDPRIREAIASLVTLNNGLQALSPPPKKEPAKAPVSKPVEEKKK